VNATRLLRTGAVGGGSQRATVGGKLTTGDGTAARDNRWRRDDGVAARGQTRRYECIMVGGEGGPV
jgi:hypothetical protein